MSVNTRPFWKRRHKSILVVLVLLPFIAVFFLTRSFILSPLIASSLEGEFGIEIEVRGARWDWGNYVFMDEIILKAEGIEGLAADVVLISEVAIEFDSALPIFNPNIIEIKMQSVRIRLAESLQHAGEFNVSHLLKSEDQTSVKSELESTKEKKQVVTPRIDLQNFIVETGVMQSGDWTLENEKTFTVTGIVQDESNITLQLIDVEDSLNIKLSFESEPLEVLAVIEDVQLDHAVFQLLPRTAKTWCEETQLNGGIKSLDITWNPIQGIQIAVTVENIQFQLPEEHGVPWAAYSNGVVKRIRGDASLDVQHGRIIYDGQSVFLQEIRGLLVPPQQEMSVPLEFSAEMKIYNFESVGEQPGEQWMNSMVSNSPFEITFTINNFSPTENHPGEVSVPLAAAEMLKLFQLKDWNMNAKVSVKREKRGDDIEVKGDLIIGGATGFYENFPYPLKDIKSLIKFDKNKIQIVYLNALGSEDAPVHISGEVLTGTDFHVVDLNLHVDKAPLDQMLHDALSKPIANVMDRLLDNDAYNRISKTFDNSYGTEFVLGGSINLDLEIKHDSRNDTGVELSGAIAFQNIGIVHSDFPFPIVLREGIVNLDPKGLYIPESNSIRFKGRDLGVGELSGSIYFLDNGNVIPDITIELLNERISPALVEAVSDSAGDSYELAAGILGGLGLASRVNTKGTVVGDENGNILTNFIVEIVDGTSKPNAKLAHAIHATGPFWPEGFEFTEIKAEIHIDNGAVTMNGVTCKCETGSLEVSLAIDKGEFDLVISGIGLPISPQFVDVLPKSVSEKLSRAWHWLEPTGVMDALIRMSYSENKSELHMTIEPKKLHVTGQGRSTNLELENGSIVVEGTNVFFNDLEFQLFETEKSQGFLDIHGEVHGEDSDFGFFLNANWNDAQVDSPLTRAITGIVGGEAGVNYYDAIEPSGDATATLTARGDAGDIEYSIEIVPTSLSATFHERRAEAVFDGVEDSTKNIIRFNNGVIHFDHLFGKLGDGDFSLDGKIVSGESIDGKFNLTWAGPSGDESLFAILPRVVGDTLVAVEIQDGKSTLPNGRVSFLGSSWDDLLIAFFGDISLDDVSIDVGIPLKKIKGVMHVFGTYSDEQLSEFEMSMVFEELSTLGRVVTDVAGKLEFDSSSNRFVFNEVRGESTTGGVTVDGWIALDESKEYEIEILIAGIELSSVENEEIVASLEGELRGWISIAGKRGDPESRRGVGMVRVDHGHLEIDPLSLTTMRVLQLALPTASKITGAVINLYIDGDQIILQDITLRSSETDISNLVLEGEGTIDFETFRIHARLHPRAGLPIIRDIAGLFNDQLYSIDVTGELLDLKVSVVPLPFLSPNKD